VSFNRKFYLILKQDNVICHSFISIWNRNTGSQSLEKNKTKNQKDKKFGQVEKFMQQHYFERRHPNKQELL